MKKKIWSDRRGLGFSGQLLQDLVEKGMAAGTRRNKDGAGKTRWQAWRRITEFSRASGKDAADTESIWLGKALEAYRLI